MMSRTAAALLLSSAVVPSLARDFLARAPPPDHVSPSAAGQADTGGQASQKRSQTQHRKDQRTESKGQRIDGGEDDEVFDVYKMLKAATESAGSKAPVPKECMWRQTGSCLANGQREPDSDVSCELAIPKGASGYCDCDGDGYINGAERGFDCNEAPMNCRSYCGLGVPPGGEGEKVTSQCVPGQVQEKWRKDFKDAVDTMLQKTQHGMEHGLQKAARSMTDLLDGVSCGDLATFTRFKDQAERLRVLASVRHLGAFGDTEVKYEPLKTLMVGDADIHSELNALIIGWQLKKKPEAVGHAFADLLNDFEEEEESEGGLEAPVKNADAPPAPTPPPAKEDHHDSKNVRTVQFWAEALSVAFEKYGDRSGSITADCLTEAAAESAGQGIEAGFNTMLEKNRRSMSRGLKLVAKDVIGIVDSLEIKCNHLKYIHKGPERLRASADRMVVLAGAKTLVDFAEHVEYEAMKALKVGGIDVHSELNRFIMAWINNQGPKRVGEGLADFFEDFEEAKDDDDQGLREESDNSVARTPVKKMVLDAFAAAGGELSEDCFDTDSQDLDDFEAGVNTAIDHMLKKRKKTMQTGLRELADTTDAFVRKLPGRCSGTAGAVAIHRAATKVRNLTRRTIVDYGTHIQYEAMKSLKVGNVPIHTELNSFITSWKLRSIDEAGRPFGDLFAKLSTIEGNDEL